MTDQALQELSKQTINILKFEEATTSWHDSYLTVLTEKGVHFFEFTHNIQSTDKRIDCIQSIINHPKYSPAETLFTDRVINKEMRNVDMTEMITDHALWPHNNQLLTEMSTIIDFKWSPVGVINNHDSAIAILTNVGVVEVHIQPLFHWECALYISILYGNECMINLYKPKTFTMLKELAYTLATTAICWSPVLNQDKSCYLVTAQKNGNILLWLIECRGATPSAKLLGSLQSDSCEFISVVWIPTTDEKFLLICSNVLGQIIVFKCQIQNDTFELIKSYTIWSYKDRMITKFMEYVQIDSNLVLICNKHRHLLVLMIDSECEVMGHYENNICDYRITCINKADNVVYITTINRNIYTLEVSMNEDDNELQMSLNLVEYQALSPTHELYSISFSPNKILYAICAVDRKVNCRKDPMKVEIILMSTKEKLDSLLDLLLENPTKHLTNLWDVIEVLRCKTLKSKEAPPVDFEVLYELACSDMYMHKVYLLLSTLCSLLKKQFKLGQNFHLPEESLDIVREEVLVSHAENLLQKYYQKFNELKELEDNEREYFLGAKKFLQYFFEKNKRNISEAIDPKILSIMESDSSFICQCCDEKVEGFTCVNKHLNMFCALTFTPINCSSYLICKWCNLTARKELFSENPLCLYCDVHLKFVNE